MAFAIKDIAGVAFFRLGLTGTLFRTDERAIEFLNYDDDGRVAHYESSYEMALRDGCISEAYFRWLSASVDVGYLNGDGRETLSFHQSSAMLPAERARLLSAADST